MGEAANRKKSKIQLPYMYYFSYVGTSRPEGSAFIGCVYVEEYSSDAAINLVESLGLVPQGEPIETLMVHKRSAHMPYVPERFRNRLLNLEELKECTEAMGDRLIRSSEFDVNDYDNIEEICQPCGVDHQRRSQRH